VFGKKDTTDVEVLARRWIDERKGRRADVGRWASRCTDRSMHGQIDARTDRCTDFVFINIHCGLVCVYVPRRCPSAVCTGSCSNQWCSCALPRDVVVVTCQAQKMTSCVSWHICPMTWCGTVCVRRVCSAARPADA